MLVPRPTTAVVGGQPIRDEELLVWAREVIDTVVDRNPQSVQG
jgi:transcription-repair coupling factor (superfamily II helicase)